MRARLLPAFISRSGKPFIQIYTAFVLLLFCWTAYQFLRFPFGVDYGEAPIMDQAIRIERSQVLYKTSIEEPPYTISNYPPLYPATIALLNSAAGIPLFQAGRLVSVFFSLMSGAVIGWLGYHLTHSKLLGILALAIFLGNPYVLVWSSIARVDMMALAFSLLGLWAIYETRVSKYWLIAAVAFFLLSIYTRQSYLLAGPLAGLAWLWYRDRRAAVYFLLSSIAATLLIFGMINAITHGGFYSNVILANINRYELSRTLQMVKQLITFWSVILILAVAAFIFVVRTLRQKKDVDPGQPDELRFMVYGLGGYSVGAVVSALTIGKVGSDVNYFLELIAVCSLWCAIGIKYLLDQRQIVKYFTFGLITLQLLWAFLAGVVLSRTAIIPKWNDLPNYNALFSQVQKASQKGIVLSDDYLDMVVLSGQSIYYQPFEYGQLYQAGLWDPTQFAGEITQGSFPLILIGGTVDKPCCWPLPVANAIRDNYDQTVTGSFLIFTPKK